VDIVNYQDGRSITVQDEAAENQVILTGLIDNGEKRRARRRTREGQAKKASSGQVLGAVPFGYVGVRDKNDERTDYQINAEQAPTVVRIFQLYAEGRGCKAIMAILRTEGAAAPGPLGWSKNTIKNLLKRPIYTGTLRFRCSTGDTKVRNQENEVVVPAPHLRIVPEDLERRVRDRQGENKVRMLRHDGSTKKSGTFISKPESSGSAAHMCNVICKCHVCGSSLIYWNRGKTKRYMCSRYVHRGKGSCSNATGVNVEALDLGIKTKLLCMLNDDFDTVLDLCMEQAEVHRAKQAIPKDERAQLEREKVRLEKAIDKLMDQIELGQSVKDRLKLREEELAQVKDRIAQADVPTLSRDLLADSLKPLGPLCALGVGDPVAIRQILRKIGVTSIVVTPDGNGWRFEGQADFKGAVHPRTPEGPPIPPKRAAPV
jgi:site-specific DNA recombinase